MAEYNPISDKEKVTVVSSFIKQAPPGEFNEVFNDVRILLGNDALLKDAASGAFADYNMEQLVPAKGDDDHMFLISEEGKVGGSNTRFLDPRSKKSYKYDHLRKECSEPQNTSGDAGAESWRLAIEKHMLDYCKEHFPHGVLSVYGSSSGGKTTITVCLEDHKYSPQNFWNGRWRSHWVISIGSGAAELKGTLKVQVHYYEDGNVQLISSKEVKESVRAPNEDSANQIVKTIRDAEGDYQVGINDNYKTMSSTTFKALRRQLPITRTKVDWDKILFHNVGKELAGVQQ